jgi:hypothetical protein
MRMNLRKPAPRQPTIEGARLQTGEEGGQIIVVVWIGHEGFFPYCFLMEVALLTRSMGLVGKTGSPRPARPNLP